MNVFELFAKLGLDTSEYEKGLDDSEKKASSFGENLGKTIGTGAKIAGAALAATGAAAIGAGSAFAQGISNTAALFDTIDKGSQKMGISAEKYQEWDFILQHNGSSIESLRTGMKTLANAVESGNEAFERIGLTQEQIASMSQEELFAATIQGLQNVESTTERTYLAGQLLGRGATELGSLLNMTAEETDQMRQSVHDLGGVMSDTAIKDGARFQDALQDMTVSFNGVKNSLLSQFLPSISTVMEGLSKVFSGSEEEGLKAIDNGVQNFISAMNSTLPKAMQIGGKIITTLISAISKNLPSLLQEGSAVLSELIQGIIVALPSLLQSAMIIISAIGSALLDNAELLLNTGIELLMILMNGLTDALPSAIPAIISIITMIITTLTAPENLNAFIQGALALIMALADGIVVALPQLVAVIPTVIENLVSALIDNAPLVLETTLYLIGALTVAVLEALMSLLGTSLSDVGEGISNIFNSVKNWFSKIGQFFANTANKFLKKVVDFLNAIVRFLENPKEGVENAINYIKTSISNGIQNIKNFLTNAKNFTTNTFTNIKNFVTNTFENLKTFIPNAIENIKNNFTNKFNAMKNNVFNIFNNIKQAIQNAINTIKGILSGEISFPKIKMPHFKINGQFSLNPPSVPTLSIEWYKKAMNTPYLLDGATIFGAANGKLLGGGEAGSELVIGTDKLMSMMREATIGGRDIIINVYGTQGQNVRELAKEVSKELQNLINDKEKVYA